MGKNVGSNASLLNIVKIVQIREDQWVNFTILNVVNICADLAVISLVSY